MSETKIIPNNQASAQETALDGITVTAEQINTAVANTNVNSKGDMIVATADDTATNLPVGADGQVITADSSETEGVKWDDPTVATSGTLSDISTGTISHGLGKVPKIITFHLMAGTGSHAWESHGTSNNHCSYRSDTAAYTNNYAGFINSGFGTMSFTVGSITSTSFTITVTGSITNNGLLWVAFA